MDNTDDAEKQEKFRWLNKQLMEKLGIFAISHEGSSLPGPDEEMLEAKKIEWYLEEQSKSEGDSK